MSRIPVLSLFRHPFTLRTPVFARCTAVVAALGVFAGPAATQQRVSPEHYAQLEFRHIGPVGNRISAVHGVTGDPLTYYAGAASGGLWKSVDGGLYWEPLFDDQDVHSIGSIDVSESDSQILWAGTGEPHIRSNVTIGDGVYRSLDGGATWSHRGLNATGRVSKVLIHPTDPDVVYIAALGHVHAPQRERGIFRTRDGGETWEHVLFVDEGAGASDLVMDPSNPRILFAGMWTVQFNTWGRRSGGPLSGIYTSRDAGDTWTKLEGNGLPSRPVGKIGLCMTPADPDRIYALIETGDGVPWEGQATDSGELWRSDDGGASWQLMTHSRNFGGRTGYYNNCRVLPDDPDEAMFLTAAFTRSIDGRPHRDRPDRTLASRRRLPRPVDRSDRRRPLARRERPRCIGQPQPRQVLAAHPAAGGADVPCHRGQRDSLQRSGEPSGRPQFSRPVQQPLRRLRRKHDPPWRLALGRRRRERLRDA